MVLDVPDALLEFPDGNHHGFVAVIIDCHALIAEIETDHSARISIECLVVAKRNSIANVCLHDTGNFNKCGKCNGDMVIRVIVLIEGYTGFDGLSAGVANLTKYIHD